MFKELKGGGLWGLSSANRRRVGGGEVGHLGRGHQPSHHRPSHPIPVPVTTHSLYQPSFLWLL